MNAIPGPTGDERYMVDVHVGEWASRTPVQRAVPARVPPTSLDTHVSVMTRSTRGMASSSSYVSSNGRSTWPCTRIR